MGERLTDEERGILLELARHALEDAAYGRPLAPLDLGEMPKTLQRKGASFVTLTRLGHLRGCIGALQPTIALAEDVREHALAAATKDFRFPAVQPDELEHITIEISRLTVPSPLEYDSPETLLNALQPGVDGVVLKDGFRRATFLPQVWEKLPDPVDFLDHLCQKMGANPGDWRWNNYIVEVYQVEEFHE